MIEVSDLMDGKIPPWVRRFVKQTGRGINHHAMIRENDSVLISVSGGKDSLALSLALALRKRWLPIDYQLKALHIDWAEYPIPDDKLAELKEFFRALNIPFESTRAHMFSTSFNGQFNCYLCSRNRRRILFEYAREQDIEIIAMGHHLDDIVETTLINLCFRAKFESMQPVQEFFEGKLHVIRPMCEVREARVEKLAREVRMPVAKAPCPYDKTNIRSQIKPIVSQLNALDCYTREHIYDALNYTEDQSKDKSK
jgi:tRNA 2-thiocytidine biosynthesis protein TtcA